MAEALQVSPNKLCFGIELDKTSTARITLSNPTALRVAFKIRTTAPELYSVKPAAGVLPPGGKCTLEVTRAKAKKLPVPGEKCKDKLRVEALTMPDGVENVSSELFHKYKLYIQAENVKVVLIPASATPKQPPLAASPISDNTQPAASPPAPVPAAAPAAAATAAAPAPLSAAAAAAEPALGPEPALKAEAVSCAANMAGQTDEGSKGGKQSGAAAGTAGAAKAASSQPAAAAAESADEGPSNLAADGEQYVGRLVAKKFGGKTYQGKVVSYDPETTWWLIKYEDSDSEDIGWEELQRIMKPDKKSKGSGGSRPVDGSKHSAKAVGTSEAGAAAAGVGQEEGAAAGSKAGTEQNAGTAAGNKGSTAGGDKGSAVASAAKGKDSSATVAADEKGGAPAQRKRSVRFPHVDPKDRCGECKHCLNPQWHKACLVARQRMEEEQGKERPSATPPHTSSKPAPAAAQQTPAPPQPLAAAPAAAAAPASKASAAAAPVAAELATKPAPSPSATPALMRPGLPGATPASESLPSAAPSTAVRSTGPPSTAVVSTGGPASTAPAAVKRGAAAAVTQHNLVTPAAAGGSVGEAAAPAATETTAGWSSGVSRPQRANKGKRLSGLLAAVHEQEAESPSPEQPKGKGSRLGGVHRGRRGASKSRSGSRGAEGDEEDCEWVPPEDELEAEGAEGGMRGSGGSGGFMEALADVAMEDAQHEHSAAQRRQRQRQRQQQELGWQVKKEKGSSAAGGQGSGGGETIDLTLDSDEDLPLSALPSAGVRAAIGRRGSSTAAAAAAESSGGSAALGDASAGRILTCSKKGAAAKRAKLVSGGAGTMSQATTVLQGTSGWSMGEATPGSSRPPRPPAAPRTKSQVRGRQPSMKLSVESMVSGEVLMWLRVKPHTPVSSILGALEERNVAALLEEERQAAAAAEAAEAAAGGGGDVGGNIGGSRRGRAPRAGPLVCRVGGVLLEKGQTVKGLGLRQGDVLLVSN